MTNVAVWGGFLECRQREEPRLFDAAIYDCQRWCFISSGPSSGTLSRSPRARHRDQRRTPGWSPEYLSVGGDVVFAEVDGVVIIARTCPKYDDVPRVRKRWPRRRGKRRPQRRSLFRTSYWESLSKRLKSFDTRRSARRSAVTAKTDRPRCVQLVFARWSADRRVHDRVSIL